MRHGSPQGDDAYWAGEMIRIIGEAEEIVARGRAVFFAADNTVEFAAARMLVIDLDVAAERLSDDFRRAHDDIAWRALARARDKYAHHYANIDRLVVWNLLRNELPRMARSLRTREL